MRTKKNKKVRMEEMRMEGTEEMEMEITEEMRMEETNEMEIKGMDKIGINSALTWWNSHKRAIGVDDVYAMKWAGLMKLMTEVMVPNEEDRVERFIGGLPDNIQGNVIAANLARLQDAIRIANQLMDKKLQGYAARSVENKRRMKSNPRDNRGHQPPFKRQNTTGQNEGIVCYKCGRPGHFRKDCPKLRLRNQNHGNQTRNKAGNKTGGNEVTAKVYAIGGGGTNPDSNVVT
nr:hypothetical protein [Tanacetum cinerariifolium]